MAYFAKLVVLTTAASMIAACGDAGTLDAGAVDGEDADSVGSVEEAKLLPVSVRPVRSTGTGSASASCPSSHPRSFGTGHGSASGLQHASTIFGPGSDGDLVGKGATTRAAVLSTAASAFAVCSEDTGQEQHTLVDSDGDAVVECPVGMIAVGGGGRCTNTGARLVRSRPTPDRDGSTPTGWRASCNSGPISASVTCWNPVPWGATCRTKRVDTSGHSSSAMCGTATDAKRAVAVGAYCDGSDNFISSMLIDDAVKQTRATCTRANVHGYSICCDGMVLDSP